MTDYENGMVDGYDKANQEWIRVLTHYVPALDLAVFSPQTVGFKLRELLRKGD